MTHRTPKIITQPEGEPISVDEARAWLEAQRYDDSDVDAIDDAIIEGCIAGAREYCEDFLGLSLSVRTLEIQLDEFPKAKSPLGDGIELPMGPVINVESVFWGEGSDDELDDDAFTLDNYRNPNRVKPVASWPSATGVRIRYVAGYGDMSDTEPVPNVIKSALLLMIAHLFENRKTVTEVQTFSMPIGVKSLLMPRRVRLGMA